jgi:hypothetical protein
LIPHLSAEQLEQSRKAAAQARHKRAVFKQRLRCGELVFGEALEIARKDEVLSRMKVTSLLRTMPRVGEKRAVALMERHTIAPSRRIRGLGKHQLEALRTEFPQ